MRTELRELLELDRIVEIEHEASAEPERGAEREIEALCDERVGAPECRAESGRLHTCERLVTERGGARRDHRQLVSSGEAARQLDDPDPRAGHLGTDAVLAMPDDLHAILAWVAGGGWKCCSSR